MSQTHPGQRGSRRRRSRVILESCFMLAPDLDPYVPAKQAVAKAIAETLSNHMRSGSKGRTASVRNDRALGRTRFRTRA